MPVQIDPSGRGASLWGIRIRGIAVVLALVAAVYTTVALASPSRAGEASFTIIAEGIGDGVDTSTQVRLHGLPIGTVTKISTQSNERVLKLSVKKARLGELSTAMQTRFVSANAFGSTAIELIPQSGGQPISAGTVINYQDVVKNYTVTSVLRSSESLILDVVTPQLSDALNNAADLSNSVAPAVTAGLAVLRAWKESDPIAIERLLRTTATTLQPMGPVVDASMTMLKQLLDIDYYDDPHLVDLASKALPGFTQFAFGFIADLLVASTPVAPTLDLLTAYLGPTTYSLRSVTPEQLGALITHLDGALAKSKNGRVSLNTEVLVNAFPAIGVPLMQSGGARR